MLWIVFILFLSAICLVYRVFKIKPQPVNIALFVTSFCIALIGIMTLWKLGAPTSTRAVVSRYDRTFVVPSPAAAVGAFIDTSELFVVAPFKQQMLVNVKPGQEVELVFKSHPGQVFHGKVDPILEATGEGQANVNGALPSASQIGSPGILAVKILLNDDEGAVGLDLGTAGSIAIYTDTITPIHILSRVTMRMNRWLYFLPFM